MITDNMLLFLMLFMITLNILINYLYRDNIVFPTFFALFEILFAISIISLNELFLVFCLVFAIIYNLLIVVNMK